MTTLIEYTRQIHVFEWQDRKIEVMYESPCQEEGIANSYPNEKLALLEIKSLDGKPTSISDSGFRFRYLDPAHIDSFGGPVQYVSHWLKEKTYLPGWVVDLNIHSSEQLNSNREA